MTDDDAVREAGWIAREARELIEAIPNTWPQDEAWLARKDAYLARKRALPAHIEARR